MRIKCFLLIFLIGSILFPIIFSPKKRDIIIKIREGDNLEVISKNLKDSKIIQDRIGFNFLVILTKKSRSLSYGWYKFKIYENPRNVIRSLLERRRLTVKITIPEGLKASEIINIFWQHREELDIDVRRIDSLIRDKNFIKELGIEAKTLEGYLFPNTYFFYKGERAENVIKKMVFTLFSIIPKGEYFEVEKMKFNLHEILTIASMIEKEAMVDREKPIIASVIYNRLKKQLPLQIDATVIYALGRHKNRVLYKDLKIESSYNTYQNKGLPPGPIANPGQKSIIAALYPAKTDYLYYVATGKGTHIFTRTYKEHLQVKKELQERKEKPKS
ncbi:MAG: endolytic transglycosylase MltG [candidate division WOR-3 bacterium]